MPIVVDSPVVPSAPPAVVAGSLAVELEWAMASPLHPDWLDDNPTLGTIYERHPGLDSELREFWPKELSLSCEGFLELVVLAHHAGLVTSTDAAPLLDALPEAAATAPTDARLLPLRSETAEDRRAVLTRLGQLRRSKGRRQRYVDLVRRTWEAVRDDWESHGRSSVDHAVAVKRRALTGGAGWQDVAETACFSEHLGTTVATMGPEGHVLVVPAFYTHKGMFVDLPGLVVVGVRSESDVAVARARTERLARRLKTLSDPTRLAILDTLRRGARSVSELAETFSLAQPTVSNHVKVLRDAGLVADERDGRRRRLVVCTEEVNRLVGGLQDVLAPDQSSRPAGS
jgi:DNA-binding transcriptional ArsR family regulator